MAKLLEIDEKELLTIWLADKVLDTVDILFGMLSSMTFCIAW
jgi:hypothetical protein